MNSFFHRDEERTSHQNLVKWARDRNTANRTRSKLQKLLRLRNLPRLKMSSARLDTERTSRIVFDTSTDKTDEISTRDDKRTRDKNFHTTQEVKLYGKFLRVSRTTRRNKIELIVTAASLDKHMSNMKKRNFEDDIPWTLSKRTEVKSSSLKIWSRRWHRRSVCWKIRPEWISCQNWKRLKWSWRDQKTSQWNDMYPWTVVITLY